MLQINVQPAVKQNINSPGCVKMKWFTDIFKICPHVFLSIKQFKSLTHIFYLHWGHLIGYIVISWTVTCIESW
jgi:hypothetical protein